MDKSINYLQEGCVKMAQIADNMKYSQHYINREFKKNMGFSLKQYSEIIRLQSTIMYLEKENVDFVYDKLGYYDQARDVLLQAVNKDSDEARLLLGKVYLAMEDTVSARSVYQEYLSRKEDAAEAYNGLALCDIAEQNYDAALQNIEQGLAKAGEDEKQSLLFNRIVVYEYKLDFEQAKSYMAEYVKAYPDDEAAARENQFLQTR